MADTKLTQLTDDLKKLNIRHTEESQQKLAVLPRPDKREELKPPKEPPK